MIDIERLLLPWKYEENKNTHTYRIAYRRRFLCNNENWYIIYFDQIMNCWKNYHTTATDLEDNKKKLDEVLISRGYILIPEGKEDYYRLLV
jgi:hypothetical protein